MDYNKEIKKLIESWHDKASMTKAKYEEDLALCRDDIEKGVSQVLRCGEFFFKSHADFQGFLDDTKRVDVRGIYQKQDGDVFVKFHLLGSYTTFGDILDDSIMIKNPPSLRYSLDRRHEYRTD